MHKILVIDDDPTGTALLIDLLRFAGYQGCPLENWHDPISCVEQEHPGLVIMDVRLGARNGLELLRQLRAHPNASIADTPVLMMSAADLSTQCRAAGASGFVEKPFDTESLFRIIGQILEVSL